MDTVTPDIRSRIMRAVRSIDTGPEMVVRRAVHAMGFRYRLHRRDLPGTPDLVFPGRGKVILVHGCYWHRHKRCHLASTPRSNTDFWQAKFGRNIERDRRTQAALRSQGWDVMIVWQCQTREIPKLCRRLRLFLDRMI